MSEFGSKFVARPFRFAAASYNIHQCVGMDGRCDPGRVAQVIRELEVDIIGLQEVDSRPGLGKESMQMDFLANATGLDAVPGHTIQRHDGDFGNVLLTRHPIREVRQIDLSVPGREPRGAIDADVDIGGHPVRVIVTHLGLQAAERRQQVKRLLEVLREERSRFVMVLGDFNEWLPWGRPLRWLHAHLGKPAAARTFPTAFRCLALDRIWMQPRQAIREIRVHDTRLTRVASDHLPLRASVLLDAALAQRIFDKQAEGALS